MNKKLKILYVGNFSEGWTTEMYIAKSFEALGHSVKKMQETTISDDHIIRECKEGYDFLLYAKFRIDGDQKRVLENVSIPKVCWFFDVYPETPREKRLNQPWIKMADYLFTTDDGHNDFYKNKGIKHKCIRQGIFHEEAVDGVFDKNLKTKVFFAGALNHWFSPRQEFVDFLERTYLGDFVRTRKTTRQKRLSNAIASAEIVVSHNIRFPRYWSNRIYEMLGRGGFLITPAVDGLDEEFEDGKHIVCYKDRDWQDLKNKIDYYLEHKEEREKIRVAGAEHCRNNFTYKHRIKELLKHIYENNNSDGKRQGGHILSRGNFTPLGR